jgi:hypothetical protein
VVKRALIAVATAAALLLPAGLSEAEHEVFYRYTVLGYVKDAAGKPVRGREVSLVRDRTGFSYLGESDGKGLYVIVVRLGDESQGESLTLRTAGRSLRLTVRFDVANRVEERGTRMDVEGTKFVERSAWFPSTLALFLASPPR